MLLKFSVTISIVVLLSIIGHIPNIHAETSSPIVSTQHGALEGLNLQSRNGNPYYAFLGIPYGEFPGRFEVAKKHSSWDGVRLAKEFGSVCAQVDLLRPGEQFIGEEMCLFLNIYTPTLDKSAGLPVMFYIHGGGFMSWSGNDFDGKYFADENVIVVSINYRLGPLGFLSFGEEDDSMANIGLKDQLLALQWVNKNIKEFGGDASKVSIAGYSAGAASVEFHMFSKQSTGLYRAAISQSGSALSFWALQRNPRENAIRLASIVECQVPPEVTSKETLACLKSKPANDITVAQMKLKEWLGFPILHFAPSIEIKKEDSFISEHPETLLRTGNYNKVNWIAGITEDEGALFDVPLILNKTITETLENKWEEKAPILLGYNHLPKSEKDMISKKINDHYFGHMEIDEMSWSSLRNLITDRYFLEPLVTSLKLRSQHSDGRNYPYVFKFAGDFGLVESLYGLKGDPGICHGDDLQYLFPGGGGFGSPDYSGDTPHEIVEFSRKFVKLWANFIEKTQPTETWNEKVGWKHHSNSKAPLQFYEIAIQPGVWDEDISRRLKVWNEVFSKNMGGKAGKTEL